MFKINWVQTACISPQNSKLSDFNGIINELVIKREKKEADRLPGILSMETDIWGKQEEFTKEKKH